MPIDFGTAFGGPALGYSSAGLDPLTQQSLLRTLARPVASGLSTLGTVLDTPGAFVRTALAGENPFPGIFDSSQRVSGRDLLQSYGMLERNRPGLDFGDVLGFGAEVLTDPLTYLTFGGSALTKSGRVARAAGQLDDFSRVGRMTNTLDDLYQAAEPAARTALENAAEGQGLRLSDLLASGDKLGGALGVGLPFRAPSFAVGTGETSQRIGGLLDDLGTKVSASYPGRVASAMFDPAVKGTLTPEAQAASRALTSAQNAGRREALTSGYQAMDLLDRTGLPDDQLTRMLDVAVERSTGNRYASELASQLGALEAPVRRTFESAVGQMVDAKDALYAKMQDVGLYAPELLDEEVQHFPRYLSDKFARTTSGRRLFDTQFESAMSRSDMLRNIPGGRAAINAMGADPTLAGSARLSGGDAIDRLMTEYGVPDKGQAKAIAGWLARRPDDALGPVYGSPVRDSLVYQLRGNEALAAAETVQDFLAQHAKPLATADEPLTPLGDVLRGSRFVDPTTGGVSVKALERIAAKAGVAAEDVAQMGVPRPLAADVGRMMKGFSQPESMQPVLQAMDSFLNLWKTGVTSPFPGFHVRNRMAGLWQNWVIGGFDPKVESQTDALLRRGSPLEDAATIPAVKSILQQRGVTPTAENGTKVVQELAFANDLIGRYQAPGADTIDTILEDFGASIPGRNPIGRSLPGQVGKSLYDWFPKDLDEANPLNVRGVLGRTETTFAPAKAGQEMGHYVEQMNRLAPFVSLMKQGFDPAAAAAKVKAAQVDYSARAFTDFERGAMTRMMPFYKFTRSQVPFVLRQLVERPGGPTAQAIRGSTLGREDDTLAPPHVTRGLAIGLGEDAEGGRKYLSGFGLPHEDPLSLMQVGGTPFSTLGATGMELLGRLSPLIKAPIEIATGRQLFAQGRDLRDADPTLGRLLSNVAETVTGQAADPVRLPPSIEYGLSATPFVGRSLSTLRGLFDPRKTALERGLGAASGVRIIDVSPQAQEAQLRDMLQNLLRDELGAKVFSKTFVPESTLNRLGPQERLKAAQAQAILNALSRDKVTLDQLGF